MLRRFAAAAVLTIVPFCAAHADPDAGCGAGSKIWAGQHGTPFKLMAATTNAATGSQTFGISSGTLGCHQDGTVTTASRIPLFASANLDQLAADMAAGHGESLAALAALYGIPEADRAGFFVMAQSHYSEIFGSPDETSDRVVAALNAVMKADGHYAHFAV